MSEFLPSEVVKGLYLSGIFAVSEKNLLERNIKLVLNLTFDTPMHTFNNVRTDRIEIDDLPTVNIMQYFDPCCSLIDQYLKKDHGVLVHCIAGVSRSASICLAFLMRHRSMKLREAYDHLKNVRPQIRPNLGFFEQLIEYEKGLYGETTVKMVSGVDGRVPDVYKMDQDSALGYFFPLSNNAGKSVTKAPSAAGSNSSIKHHNTTTSQGIQRKTIPSSTSPNKVLKPRGLRLPSPQLQAVALEHDSSSSETVIKKASVGSVSTFVPDSGSEADDEMSLMSIITKQHS